MKPVSRWELITSDEYLKATADSSILYGHSFKDLRTQLYDFLKRYRDELLEGNPGLATEKQPTTQNQGV